MSEKAAFGPTKSKLESGKDANRNAGGQDDHERRVSGITDLSWEEATQVGLTRKRLHNEEQKDGEAGYPSMNDKRGKGEHV